ncbi:LuxR C-terminal-related transcriptional regulator [Actinomycetospora sp. TBRC 11914]|uniref:helix-turn-helix transcriptional regulator n=1 Tax=Actinomycetospora sp. TBRC 11914 TaxID=2729387 RepID=UPI00145C67B0|nr:LuxR C-terminal-related transcriptional regulator [Actinomycetospora sp. TBRC 11914]NMO93926.1 LuxR family transcriptional regulator [Actinomycetospora sp. TBRC 11914]
MTEGVRSPTAFVGRTAELAELCRRAGVERLVTVVGPGGGGKTRLVTEAVPALPAPVVGVVELAACAPGDDLWTTVLDACGIRDDPTRAPADRFAHRVGDDETVLVLDNCEHVRDAAARRVVELADACRGLRVVATSRVSLGVPGEATLAVEGLPDDEAAVLFLDRARRAQPALPGGEETDHRVRRIVRALDGLPLALELAAARARGLPLAAIEAGMTDRLAFVAARSAAGRDVRHRSLQACLAWSTALLDERARAGLAALAVVEGRCSLEAAVAVVGEPGAVTALEELVDHSLVRFRPDDATYLVLETVRDHAREAAPDEVPAAHARLARWVADLAAAARPALEHADLDVLARLDRDAAAIRTVLAHAGTGPALDAAADVVADLAFWWSLRGRCREGHEVAGRLAAALPAPTPRLRWAHAFQAVYAGDLVGGLGLAAELAEDATADDDVRARALILLGMAQAFDDPAAAAPSVEAAVALAQGAGDRWGVVEALQVLAYTHIWRGDHAAAVACADAALPALTELGHHQLRAWDAAIRAEAARLRGDVDAVRHHGRAGWTLAVTVGEPVSASGALAPVVRALCRTGEHAEAARLTTRHAAFLDEHPGLGTTEILDLCRAHVALWASPATATDLAAALVDGAEQAGLALVAAEAGGVEAVAALAADDVARALAAADRTHDRARAVGAHDTCLVAGLARCVARQRSGDAADVLAEAHDVLAAAHASGYAPIVVDALDVVAALVLDAGRPTDAARLHAAAAAARDHRGYVPSPLTRPLVDAVGRVVLDEDGLARARADGATLDLDAAVAYARRARGARGRPRSGWDSLTPTERDVVALAARGLRNQAIADQLLIGIGTVRTHLRRIFTKLDLTSRAELAALAVRRGL